MKKTLVASLLMVVSSLVLATLAPPSEEAKAKAVEAAAKAAWVGKVDNYKLCKSVDSVAAYYYKTSKAAGKETKVATTTPPCADPGVFSYKPPEVAKPIEAAGAHSPAATAVSPPSTKQPDAEVNPAKKP